MPKVYRLIYLLLTLIIVVGTIAAYAGKTSTQNPPARAPKDSQEQWKQREEEKKKHFPTARFDEPEPQDPQKRLLRKQKQLRHNGLGLVSKNPEPDMGGAALLLENHADLPALPTKQSSVIVRGTVLQAEAHLSEDKSNVYSEFTVQITDVLKADVSLAGQEIVIERLGGYVQYADGRKLLYRVGTGGMPKVGGRYIFFLSASRELDLSILTAYELTDKGIVPLDSSAQFENFRDYDEANFLKLVNDSLVQ